MKEASSHYRELVLKPWVTARSAVATRTDVNKNFHCNFNTLYLFLKELFQQYHLRRSNVVLNIIDIPAMLILSTTQLVLLYTSTYTFY